MTDQEMDGMRAKHLRRILDEDSALLKALAK